LPKRPPPLGTQSLYDRPPLPPLPLGEHPRKKELGKYIKFLPEIEAREKAIDEAREEQTENARMILYDNKDLKKHEDDPAYMEKFAKCLDAFQKTYPTSDNSQHRALL